MGTVAYLGSIRVYVVVVCFMSAVTYSPTPSRVQYHQRGQAELPGSEWLTGRFPAAISTDKHAEHQYLVLRVLCQILHSGRVTHTWCVLFCYCAEQVLFSLHGVNQTK